MQLDIFLVDSFKDLSDFRDNETISQEGRSAFQELIYHFYKSYGRTFAWRQTTNPYRIVVSEIMLQQTQTERVKEKFASFTDAFPNFDTLASASFSEVLLQWQGLGYNRRALSLHKLSKKIVSEYSGVVPNDPDQLVTFDGIGKATAASICAFAYNNPTLFIETNIRTVYIHTFFRRVAKVHDSEILPILQETLDRENPRIWYYALMDYGVALKKHFRNPSRKSAHHSKQSRFEGSERQIRGMILRVLTTHQRLPLNDLIAIIEKEPNRIERNLNELCKEGFIKHSNGLFSIS